MGSCCGWRQASRRRRHSSPLWWPAAAPFLPSLPARSSVCSREEKGSCCRWPVLRGGGDTRGSVVRPRLLQATTHSTLGSRALLFLLVSSLAAAARYEGPWKVAVALYWEMLCPYSARFVVDHLARIFEDSLLDAVDLTLVPYGNARVHSGGEITSERYKPKFEVKGVTGCKDFMFNQSKAMLFVCGGNQ